MKRIGFITSQEHSALYYDDRYLIVPFQKEGIEIVPVVWDGDNSFSDLDLLVFRSAWDYHFKMEQFENWLEEINKENIKIFNPISVIQGNYDKFYLKGLAEKGLPIIPTSFVENTESLNLKTLLEKNNWEKAVIKPAVSMSAYQTFSFDQSNSEVLQKELKNTFGAGRVIIQEFAQEIVEEGEWSLIFFDKHYCTAILKKPKKGDFRVQGELGGTAQIAQPSERVIWQAQRILFSFEEPLLYARVDGIIREGNFYLMELELIDPELFFRVSPKAITSFLAGIKKRI
ncbi:MAG: hypothetical protein NXI23_07180 [Bacteroidetes bacterium]|jgi:glutathione synthase/RimK-type ligase-like ATP-grasp enzyme|nr:hypothetical protein [Bacteroidota bacterium]